MQFNLKLQTYFNEVKEGSTWFPNDQEHEWKVGDVILINGTDYFPLFPLSFISL